MTIRAATTADLAAILEIYNEAVETTTATYDYEPQTMAQRRIWWEEHCRQNYAVFVAEDSRHGVVGWSSLSRFHSRIGYQYTAENSLYVAQAHRGCGWGKRLLAPLIPAAQARGLHVIIAGIDADNRISVKLHEHFGFQKVARLKEVGFKFGRWLDVIYMQLILPRSEA